MPLRNSVLFRAAVGVGADLAAAWTRRFMGGDWIATWRGAVGAPAPASRTFRYVNSVPIGQQLRISTDQRAAPWADGFSLLGVVPLVPPDSFDLPCSALKAAECAGFSANREAFVISADRTTARANGWRRLMTR